MSDPQEEPARVWVLIDGFNWYHAIKDAISQGACGASAKWLDCYAMAARTVQQNCGPHTLEEVRWYTAYVRNNQPAVDRHRWYQRALEAVGVKTILGKYKKKSAWCAKCNRRYTAWEEKATDVNIAIDIIAGAAEDSYDELFLFSGDSDLAPAVLRARTTWGKKVHVAVPAWRKNTNGRPSKHSELHKNSDRFLPLPASVLTPELPETVALQNGRSAHRPAKWR